MRPAISDPEADIDIPRRVWSSWKPSGIEARAIVRALTDDEWRVLKGRQCELYAGLQPIDQNERDRLIADSALSTMLGGFRSMRQRGEGAQAIVGVLLHLLRKFPAWAIAKACEEIATGQSGLDSTWPPNDAQIYEIVDKIVAPYRVLQAQADRLLSAPVEPPRETVSQPLPTPEQHALQMVRMIAQPTPPDPSPPAQSGYMARVLADIEARKREREERA